MPPREDDLPAIRAALTERWETLATNLLGDPVQRGAWVWRWGHKGSLSAVISGAKRGSWHDHEAGQGGGPLDLIMHAHRLSIADAIALARTWTGARAGEVAADQSELRRQAEAEAAAERDSAIGNARWLASQCQSIDGSTAESYLVHARGIPRPAHGWPGSALVWYPGPFSGTCPDGLLWHARSPGLVALARDAGGAIVAVQHIRLAPDGAKAADGRLVEVTVGSGQGAAVRLPGDPAGPLVLAEGPETGLSAWAAAGTKPGSPWAA